MWSIRFFTLTLFNFVPSPGWVMRFFCLFIWNILFMQIRRETNTGMMNSTYLVSSIFNTPQHLFRNFFLCVNVYFIPLFWSLWKYDFQSLISLFIEVASSLLPGTHASQGPQNALIPVSLAHPTCILQFSSSSFLINILQIIRCFYFWYFKAMLI